MIKFLNKVLQSIMIATKQKESVMNFTAAMKVLIGGGSVRLGTQTFRLDEEGFGLVNALSGEPVVLTAALLDATTFINAGPVIPTIGPDEVYAVFNEEKGRYVSTTEPAKHKAAGKRVAVFSLDQLI